jgi:hypothetical protein
MAGRCEISEERVAVCGNRHIPLFARESRSGNVAWSNLKRAFIVTFEDNRRNSGRRDREPPDRSPRFMVVHPKIRREPKPLIELSGLVVLYKVRFQNRKGHITQHGGSRYE